MKYNFGFWYRRNSNGYIKKTKCEFSIFTFPKFEIPLEKHK